MLSERAPLLARESKHPYSYDESHSKQGLATNSSGTLDTVVSSGYLL